MRREDLEAIAEVLRDTNIMIASDEIYAEMTYNGEKHVSIAEIDGMRERTLVISGFSKAYAMTGWRLGYTIAPPKITDRIKKVHDFLTVGAAAPLQEAVIPGLEFGQDYYDELLDLYTKKRELFLHGLDEIGLVHNVPQGAYYVMMDVSEFGYEDDLKFCEDLAAKVGVGAVPGSSFFREPIHNYVRLHFAKKEETLKEALDRLSCIREKMSR